MSTGVDNVVNALNREFLARHPATALQSVNQLSSAELSTLLKDQPPEILLQLWDGLMLDRAAGILTGLPETAIRHVMQRADPVHLARVLTRFSEEDQLQLLSRVTDSRKRELLSLVQYPDDSAGSLMDPRFVVLTADLSAKRALQRVRKLSSKASRQFYLVDTEGCLTHKLELHKLALAEPGETITSLAEPVKAMVEPMATREEVVALLEKYRITDLPVVDGDAHLIGIIHYDALLGALREESSADMLKMVGASGQERALSKVGFVVQKRLPWLSVNLLTAFLAASVVGLFEQTIAQFTALAVLLPVVAGQSGNTGAQALAVTMRGLALREIGTSQWLRVARKEVGAGFINGCAIAVLTGISVVVWSSSVGLGSVIASSMVIAMVAAAFSGVVIPVVLSSIGQDPAQSSSIILTTVTDVVGFFTFLGIATLMSGML